MQHKKILNILSSLKLYLFLFRCHAWSWYLTILTYCISVSGTHCDSYSCSVRPTWYGYRQFWKPADCFRVCKSTLLPIPTPTPSSAWLYWNGSSRIWWSIQSWDPIPDKVIAFYDVFLGENKRLIFYFLCVSVFCFTTTRKSAISERFGRWFTLFLA